MTDTRSVFAQTLISLALQDDRVVAVLNDSLSSSSLSGFKAQFPTRLYNVGIAEQNQVGFSAGLAAAGLMPWTCSATCFLTYRALEQIKNDVVYSRQNVKLVGNTTGLDYGSLGATHHSLEDLGVLRALPGLAVLVPADLRETAEIVRAMYALEGPAYLRLFRGDVPYDLGMAGSFELGKVRQVRGGRDCVIFASGRLVAESLNASQQLCGEGMQVGVANVNCLNPFDAEGVARIAAQSECVVTVEEHMTVGGLGGAVCEALSELHPTSVLRLGISGGFAIAGSPTKLREYYGLTAEAIAGRVRRFVGESRHWTA